MKHYLNVCDISGSKIEPVDVITFGSPCQDMSVAGKREGLKHSQQGDVETTRSGLFYEAIRIIKEMRESTNGEYPKYAVWENVPGAFSSNKGHDFHAVLEALCSVCDNSVSIPKSYDKKRTRLVWNGAGEIVGDNYSIAWRTLDAQYWGVPQRRKRIYLVADFTGGCAGAVLFKPGRLRGDFAQGDEARKGVAADAVGGVDGSVGVECIEETVDFGRTSDRIHINADKAVTIQAGGGGAGAKTGLYCFSFDSLSSNSMKSKNPLSGCRAVEIAKCIDTTYPDPSKNQGGIAVVQDGRSTAKTLSARHDSSPCIDRGQNVVCFENHQHGSYREGCGTLRASGGDYGGGSKNIVCYDTRWSGDGESESYGIGNGQADNAALWKEVVGTLNCMHDQQAILTPFNFLRKYIIRRLTPTECARLQGFPDWWGHLAPYDPKDAEFWEQVRKTHAKINGKKYKPAKNLKKWYDKLHTDSAEYKMWGNGIALPNAEYVIHGIARQGAKTLGSLFDGSGGFPLAGVINGIKPLWASEIEPYPIAVTKSRFRTERSQL